MLYWLLSSIDPSNQFLIKLKEFYSLSFVKLKATQLKEQNKTCKIVVCDLSVAPDIAKKFPERTKYILINDQKLQLNQSLDDEFVFRLPSNFSEQDLLDSIHILLSESVYDSLEQFLKMYKPVNNRFIAQVRKYLASPLMLKERDVAAILDYQIKLEESLNWSDLKVDLKNLLSLLNTNVSFHNIYEILDFKRNYSLFFCFDISDSIELMTVSFPEQLNELDLIKIYAVLCFFMDSSRTFLQMENSSYRSEIEEWESIWHLISYPLALFVGDNLLRYNSSFVTLNLLPLDCIAIEDGSQITINEISYQVNRSQFELDNKSYTSFLFYSNKEQRLKQMNPSKEELGIVSSSIAHELNNPLAGIIAAVDTLLMDDFSNTDFVQDLIEIKKGAMRCKQLVDTFLGFSRMQPLDRISCNYSSESADQGTILYNAFEQAISLIRFRLIENDIKITPHFNFEQHFGRDINNSILSMIIYLLLGDIITHLSHVQLLSANRKLVSLNINIFENKKRYKIFFDQLKLTGDMLTNKLIYHLSEMERLHIKVNSDSIDIVSIE